MRILAINTTTESCSVALYDNGNCFSVFKESPREHAQCILPLIKKILLQGNTTLTDIQALAFGRGPGSFTGIRIGISIAQGLALGANLPLISISTLATMAQGAFHRIGATNVLVAIDARMGEVYWAEYVLNQQGMWCGENTETVYSLENIKNRLENISGKWAIAGTGWKIWQGIMQTGDLILVDSNILLPTAEDMLPLACKLLANGETTTVEHAEPVYLRNEVVRKNF